MRFNLLGPFEIVSGEPIVIPRRQGRCLLAVLLLEQGRVVAADRLADLLWDGDPPPAARNALSTHVSRLRSVLGPAHASIDRQGQGYVLETDPERVDALRFQSLLRQARELPVPARAPVLCSALELWRGPALADLPEIRERFGAGLEEMRLQALALRIDADLAAGRHGELITELRELVAALPHRERFTVRLMLALYRSGRQADALAVYDQSRRVLAEEFGLSPGRELRELQERILRADPGLDLPEHIAAGAAALADLPVTHAKAALDHLVAAHLVEQRLPHRYELHDLIRIYAANLATTHATVEERVTAVHRALDWYLHTVVNADRQLLPHRRRDFLAPYEPIRPPRDFIDQTAATTWFATEYHNLRMIAEWATEHNFAGYAWRIAVAMTTYADRTAPVGDGVEFLEIVHQATEAANDLIGSAYTLNSLAALLFCEGDLNRAKHAPNKHSTCSGNWGTSAARRWHSATSG